MPRKPRPAMDGLFIEKLSTQALVQPNFVDDFTGEVKPLAPEFVQRMKQSAQRAKEHHERIQAQARKNAEEYIALTLRQRQAAEDMVLKRNQKMQTPAQPGQRAIALGAGLVIIDKTTPLKLWRRV